MPRWLLALSGLSILLLVAAGWIGLRAYEAYSHVNAARAEISRSMPGGLRDIAAIDPAMLALSMQKLQHETSAARDAVDDPVYQLGTLLPWVGSDLHAASVIAVTLDSFSHQVLPTLVTAVQTLQPSALTPAAGKIDLAPLIAIAGDLRAADDSIGRYLVRLGSLNQNSLRTSVNAAVNDLTTKLSTVQQATSFGAEVAQLAPTMLGSTGPRRYLVVFQNLAELRSTGGVFGSYVLLTADQGSLSLSGQGSASRDIGRKMDVPVGSSTAEQLALYGTNITTIPMDVNFTPDFALAAQNFAKMYQTKIDPTPLDGVIALDPVGLSYAMKGLPPIPLSNGAQLTSANIVTLLLSDAYTMFPDDPGQAKRDAFTSEATAAAFQAIMSTPGNATQVVTGFRHAAEDRRLLVYSFHPAEQEHLVSANVAGALPTSDAADSPTFGIFLSDRTYLGSKLGYYLDGATTVTAGECRTSGQREVTVTMNLDYSAPASGLPEYVSGSGPIPYVLVTELRVFAPSGGTLTGADFAGSPVTIEQDTDLGRSVGKFTINLEPGSTPTVTLHFLTGPTDLATGRLITPNVLITPGAHAWTLTDPAYAACSTER